MTGCDDNRGKVLAILRAAARRLAAVRAVEAAAVGAVTAGLSAAACQAGILAARQSVAAGIVLAFVPVLAVAALFRWPAIRRTFRLGAGDLVLVAGVAFLCSVAGALTILAGRILPDPILLLPAVLVPLAGVLGAVSAMLRRPTLAQAALYHDVRFGLAERLSTASQLAVTSDDPQVAACVFDQALDAARRAKIARRGLWRRTRATAGALVLGMALCAVLALVSPAGSARASAASLGEVRQHLRVLTDQEKKQLVLALRQLADRVAADPELRRRLLAAAEAAEKDQAVDRRLAELQDAVASADDAEAARIAAAILRAVGLKAPDDGNGGGGAATPRVTNGTQNDSAVGDINIAELDANTSEKPLAARTLIYNPDYAAVTDANAPEAGTPARPRPFVTYADAWSAARSRAAEALRTGTVPARHRDLVRRFFEIE